LAGVPLNWWQSVQVTPSFQLGAAGGIVATWTWAEMLGPWQLTQNFCGSGFAALLSVWVRSWLVCAMTVGLTSACECIEVCHCW